MIQANFANTAAAVPEVPINKGIVSNMMM